MRNAANQDGDLGNSFRIKRIKLEMQENWGKNKGVLIEMRHTKSGDG